MPAIYLLRHGQASFGAEDYDVLSDLGARQALVAGHELARRGARSPVVASGSLRRQRDTATIAAAALGVPTADIDTRWNEMHAHELVDDRLGAPGASAGLTSTEFQGRLDEAMAQWIDSGDPAWHAFSDGALQALTDLAAAIPRGRDAVVVTIKASAPTQGVFGCELATEARPNCWSPEPSLVIRFAVVDAPGHPIILWTKASEKNPAVSDALSAFDTMLDSVVFGPAPSAS